MLFSLYPSISRNLPWLSRLIFFQTISHASLIEETPEIPEEFTDEGVNKVSRTSMTDNTVTNNGLLLFEDTGNRLALTTSMLLRRFSIGSEYLLLLFSFIPSNAPQSSTYITKLPIVEDVVSQSTCDQRLKRDDDNTKKTRFFLHPGYTEVSLCRGKYRAIWFIARYVCITVSSNEPNKLLIEG